MMWKPWSSGHWVPLMMAFKPLVDLRRHQYFARLLALSLTFRKEPLLDLVVVVHRIHSMTLGTRRTLGVLQRPAVRQANLLTIPFTRPVVGTTRTPHGRQAIRLQRVEVKVDSRPRQCLCATNMFRNHRPLRALKVFCPRSRRHLGADRRKVTVGMNRTSPVNSGSGIRSHSKASWGGLRRLIVEISNISSEWARMVQILGWIVCPWAIRP